MAYAEVRGFSEDKMFGPLTFEDLKYDIQFLDSETKCLLCEDSFNIRLRLDIFLSHIFDVHQCVIEDAQNIKNLPEYILYWRERLKKDPVEQIIPSVKVEVTGEQYFLFSSLLKEDQNLRHKLNLDYVMKVHEFERTDSSFIRQCLFCKLQYEGSRQGYLEHLAEQHNLQLGNPQNLVFIEELINQVDEEIQNLTCIFCKGIFPERTVLKEHMRKKIHKRINPADSAYDRFYIVNYLEVGKGWQAIEKEDDRYALPRGAEENCDQEYSDWNEKDDKINCLFCSQTETDINLLCLHMDGEHGFDFVKSTETLDYYQKIKLVNYLRKMMHNNKCPYCEECLENKDSLWGHMREMEHCKIPKTDTFDQPDKMDNNLSTYAKELQGSHSIRYLQKISVLGVDPYTINIENCSKRLEDFPPTFYPDIVMYLVHTKSAYTMEELKAYKSLEAYNQATCGWVKKIGVKVFPSYKLVLGKVMHSQRLNEKLLSPWIITNEDGTVHSAHCDCVAGLGEVCTHIGAVLFSLDEAGRSREEVTRTGVKAYWMPPTNKPADPSTTAKIDFRTAKQKSQDKPIFQREEVRLAVLAPSKEDQMSLLENLKQAGGCALHNIIPPFSKEVHKEIEEKNQLSFLRFYKQEYETKSLQELRELGQKLQVFMSIEDCKVIEIETRQQSKCNSWFTHRLGRITASLFKKCCRTKIDKPSISLIKRICYPTKLRVRAMEYGCEHEKYALKDFLSYMTQQHHNFQIRKCGLYIDPELWFFGATPDGIVSCSCCGVGVLEIKCPYCVQFKSILDLTQNKYSFLKEVNGELQIKKDHDYYYQVQMQMAITKLKYSYLVGWCRKDFAYCKIVFNSSFWTDNSDIAKQFFFDIILPECLGRYYSRQTNVLAEFPEEEIEESPEESLDIDLYEELVFTSENVEEVSSPKPGPSNVPKEKETSPEPGPCKKLYCICREEDDGVTPMIACEAEMCRIEWYHLKCVGLSKIPSSVWICDICKAYSDSE
ncbi:unnamed protein product [Ceutorhynchus assimilis]|uniref:Uncharacterized protein n=1 Tax=Ceutorhynchus assimilis TaxID=467358 RepID=A0A9N9QQI6_9CUCU|nr:unnamed protein product [Ceutorhynchus assimilis]